MRAYRPSSFPDFESIDLHKAKPDRARDRRIEQYCRRVLAGKPLFESKPDKQVLMERQGAAHRMRTVAG